MSDKRVKITALCGLRAKLNQEIEELSEEIGWSKEHAMHQYDAGRVNRLHQLADETQTTAHALMRIVEDWELELLKEDPPCVACGAPGSVCECGPEGNRAGEHNDTKTEFEERVKTFTLTRRDWQLFGGGEKAEASNDAAEVLNRVLRECLDTSRNPEVIQSSMREAMQGFISCGARDTEPDTALCRFIEILLGLPEYSVER